MAIVLLALAAGCSSSSSNPDGSGGTGGQATGGTGGQAAGDAGTFTLKMENYLTWCTVTEQGTPEGTTALVTMTFPAGTVVNLIGAAASDAFVWDYWRGTDGDTGAAHDTNMTTTVTMTKDKTVQACCPFAVEAGLPTPCGAPS
jgi:hypothetical protein